jgi:hypothetical protein
MVLLRKQQERSRGLVFVLIGAFLLFLGLPQVGTLHHDHPNGDHPHVHPEFSASPFIPTHFHSDEHGDEATQSPTHSHSHSHSHPHHDHGVEHTTTSSHSHAHHNHSTATYKTGHVDFAYQSPESSVAGHWHTFSTLHRTSATHRVCLSPISLWVPFQDFAQTFLLISTPSVCQPRAPPPLS